MPIQKTLTWRENLNMRRLEFANSAGVRTTWEAFSTHPRIIEHDKIIVWLCGGAGGFGKVIKAAQLKYPRLWELVEVVVVDYDVDPEHIDDQWSIFDVGDELKNMRLSQVVAQHGIPKGLFTKAEKKEFMAFVSSKHGVHYFSDGAGANPLVGRYGMHIAKEKFQEFCIKYAMDLQEDVSAERILSVVINGSGGGTGRGVRDIVLQHVDAAFRSQELDGAVGTVEMILAWQAYSRIIFGKDGQVTTLGEKIWEDGKRDWESRSNAFFLTTDCGPDGFLALLSHLGSWNKILNNAPAREAFPNALLQIIEVTPWKLQRLSAFEINRGIAPEKNPKLFKILRSKVEVILDVANLKTIRDLAEARHILNNWKDHLRSALRERGKSSDNMKNYEKVPQLVKAQITVLDLIQQDLLEASTSSGIHMHGSEESLLPQIFNLKLKDVLAGTADVISEEDELISLIMGPKMSDNMKSMGIARISMEIGDAKSNGQRNINIPDFRGVSPEEAHELKIQAGIERANELIEATTLITEEER